MIDHHWGLTALSCPPSIPTAEEAWETARALRRPPPDPHFAMFAGLHRRLLEAGRPGGLTGLGGDDAFAACSIGGRVVSAVQLRQADVLRDLARTAARDRRRAWGALLRPTLHHLAPWKGDRLPGWVAADAAARAGLPQLLRQRPERMTGFDELVARAGARRANAAIPLARCVSLDRWMRLR